METLEPEDIEKQDFVKVRGRNGEKEVCYI